MAADRAEPRLDDGERPKVADMFSERATNEIDNII